MQFTLPPGLPDQPYELSVIGAGIASAPVSFQPFAYATLQNGVLSVSGTPGDDSFALNVSGTDILITRGTDLMSFPSADVSSILIDAAGGNDTINLQSLQVPATVSARRRRRDQHRPSFAGRNGVSQWRNR